jgi:ABC-type sugar transport system permease subunit
MFSRIRDKIPWCIVAVFFIVCLILGVAIVFSIFQKASLSAFLTVDEHAGQLRAALWNTFILFLLSCFFQLSIAFVGTLVVHKIPSSLKVLLVIPYVSGVVAPTFSIYVFFSPALGPLHYGLLGTEVGARLIIALLDSWQWSGILLLACIFKLEQTPQEQFDQIRLEGIPRLRAWLVIIWPKIRGVVQLFIAVRALDWFRKFDTVRLLFSEGGPGYGGETVGMYISRNYFFGGKEESFAALLLLLQMIILAILLYLFFLRKLTGWLDYEE